MSGLETDEISSIMDAISPLTKKAFAHAYQRLAKEGIKKDIEKGQERIIAKMISKGDTDIQISEITDIPVQEILEIRRKNRS